MTCPSLPAPSGHSQLTVPQPVSRRPPAPECLVSDFLDVTFPVGRAQSRRLRSRSEASGPPKSLPVLRRYSKAPNAWTLGTLGRTQLPPALPPSLPAFFPAPPPPSLPFPLGSGPREFGEGVRSRASHRPLSSIGGDAARTQFSLGRSRADGGMAMAPRSRLLWSSCLQRQQTPPRGLPQAHPCPGLHSVSPGSIWTELSRPPTRRAAENRGDATQDEACTNHQGGTARGGTCGRDCACVCAHRSLVGKGREQAPTEDPRPPPPRSLHAGPHPHGPPSYEHSVLFGE